MITKRDCYLPIRNSMAMSTEMSPEAIRQRKLENSDETNVYMSVYKNEKDWHKWEEFLKKFG